MPSNEVIRMTDFTKLINNALDNCPGYRKADHDILYSDKVAKYSIDEDMIDELEDNGIDTFEKYCTNKDEVELAREQADERYAEHMRTCTNENCKALRKARAEIGVNY